MYKEVSETGNHHWDHESMNSHDEYQKYFMTYLYLQIEGVAPLVPSAKWDISANSIKWKTVRMFSEIPFFLSRNISQAPNFSNQQWKINYENSVGLG